GNLTHEGITQGVHLVGDVMYDAVLEFTEIANQRSTILADLNLKPKEYLLATVHRPSNADCEENLGNIVTALRSINEPVVFPVHPRTRNYLSEFGLDGTRSLNGCLQLVEPLGYLDMLMLEQNARLILTDSGGVQKEAYFFRVPCVTLRPETEWVETVEAGGDVIVGANRDEILSVVYGRQWPQEIPPSPFCNGRA